MAEDKEADAAEARYIRNLVMSAYVNRPYPSLRAAIEGITYWKVEAYPDWVDWMADVSN